MQKNKETCFPCACVWVSIQVCAFHNTRPVLQPKVSGRHRGQGMNMFLFPVALIIGSQIWCSSCSYVIALKSSVSRREAVNTEWSTIEGDRKQIQGAGSPEAVFPICWATDAQLIMQVVINIKAGDKMGRACRSGATGDHSAALLFLIYTQLSLKTQFCQCFLP